MAKAATTTGLEIPNTPEMWWENQKTLGTKAKMATLHGANRLFTKTERTISIAKYPGIEMWWTPSGLLCEWNNRKQLIPAAGVENVDII